MTDCSTFCLMYWHCFLWADYKMTKMLSVAVQAIARDLTQHHLRGDLWKPPKGWSSHLWNSRLWPSRINNQKLFCLWSVDTNTGTVCYASHVGLYFVCVCQSYVFIYSLVHSPYLRCWKELRYRHSSWSLPFISGSPIFSSSLLPHVCTHCNGNFPLMSLN